MSSAEYRKKYYQKNREVLIERQKERNRMRRDEIKEYRDKYRLEKPHMVSLPNVQLKSKVPSWYKSEEEEIARIYLIARSMKDEDGGVMHVDHIIPLVNKMVCGLHTLANLQILSNRENARKGTKFDPDTKNPAEAGDSGLRGLRT